MLFFHRDLIKFHHIATFFSLHFNLPSLAYGLYSRTQRLLFNFLFRNYTKYFFFHPYTIVTLWFMLFFCIGWEYIKKSTRGSPTVQIPRIVFVRGVGLWEVWQKNEYNIINISYCVLFIDCFFFFVKKLQRSQM